MCISDPVRFQHRPGSHFLSQNMCAGGNVWFWFRAYIERRGSQVHRLVRLRLVPFVAMFTGYSGPELVNTTLPHCFKFICWLF